MKFPVGCSSGGLSVVEIPAGSVTDERNSTTLLTFHSPFNSFVRHFTHFLSSVKTGRAATLLLDPEEE